jgi:hypothetical protein
MFNTRNWAILITQQADQRARHQSDRRAGKSSRRMAGLRRPSGTEAIHKKIYAESSGQGGTSDRTLTAIVSSTFTRKSYHRQWRCRFFCAKPQLTLSRNKPNLNAREDSRNNRANVYPHTRPSCPRKCIREGGNYELNMSRTRCAMEAVVQRGHAILMGHQRQARTVSMPCAGKAMRSARRSCRHPPSRITGSTIRFEINPMAFDVNRT